MSHQPLNDLHIAAPHMNDGMTGREAGMCLVKAMTRLLDQFLAIVSSAQAQILLSRNLVKASKIKGQFLGKGGVKLGTTNFPPDLD